MATKKVNFNQKGIERLPKYRPVLYKIQTQSGGTNYAGIAQKGRVQERIQKHLDKIPGAKVKIEQFHSIDDAAKKEENVIKRSQPKYNKKGK
ncbi:MAG: hypothetical protein ABII27_09070 [bacterium]